MVATDAGGMKILCAELEEGELAVVHNELVLQGHVAGGSRPVSVTASVGRTEATATLDGADGAAAEAPFRIVLDTSALFPGTERLTLTARDGSGAEAAIRRQVEAMPYSAAPATSAAALDAVAAGGDAVWLDLPVEGQLLPPSSYFEALGWAYCEAGVERVALTIDGHPFAANHGLRRPDLAERDARLRRAGFSARIDPRDIPPGPHRLAAVAIGRDGSATGMERRIFLRHELQEPPAAPLAPGTLEEARFIVTPPHVGGGERVPLARAETAARLRLAEQLAPGRRILLVGEGAEAEPLRAAGAPDLTVVSGPAELTEATGRFGLVLLFESLEAAPDPAAALDRVAGLLAPGGVVLAVAADAGAYPPGNPRHESRLGAEALEAELRHRWGNVEILRQGTQIASAIGRVGGSAGRVGATAGNLEFEGAPFAVGIASDDPLPAIEPVLALADAAPEAEGWHRLAAEWEERALWAESRVQVAEAELAFVTFSLVRTLEEGPGTGAVAGGAPPGPRWKRTRLARLARRLRDRLRPRA